MRNPRSFSFSPSNPNGAEQYIRQNKLKTLIISMLILIKYILKHVDTRVWFGWQLICYYYSVQDGAQRVAQRGNYLALMRLRERCRVCERRDVIAMSISQLAHFLKGIFCCKSDTTLWYLTLNEFIVERGTPLNASLDSPVSAYGLTPGLVSRVVFAIYGHWPSVIVIIFPCCGIVLTLPRPAASLTHPFCNWW